MGNEKNMNSPGDVMQENMPQVFNLHITFNDRAKHKADITKKHLSVSVK
jgi:hypothetical protein